jgi:hypothetical protein
MNYKIIEKHGKFEVHEVTTNQIIEIFKTRDDAKTMLRRLNFGGAFDGWTPRFILKKVDLSQFKSL